MNFPYGESDFRLWDRIKLDLERSPGMSLSKRLRAKEIPLNRQLEIPKVPKGEPLGPPERPLGRTRNLG